MKKQNTLKTTNLSNIAILEIIYEELREVKSWERLITIMHFVRGMQEQEGGA